jgi:adenylate cyclase
MANSSKTNALRKNRPLRRGLREEDLSQANQYIRAALIANKRDGLLLAVRARWVALAIISLLIAYLNFSWAMLYYQILLGGFAAIGWAQIKVGEVAQSRRELVLIFCDLALLTFVLVVPNPFADEPWPTAFQYHLGEFSYFYVLLASATMAYSWRTVVACGTWTTGLWVSALILVILFGTEIPALTEGIALALAGHGRMLEFLDPNDPQIPARVQEIVVFLIVAEILALNSRRTNQLIIDQAEVARERGNLARHFPPNIVDQLAERDQPLEAVRSQYVAVLFVDIVGFTRVADRQTPEEVVALLRAFHARMERAVFDHHGTLDKFLGDGLMATFGTPDRGTHDAGNAVRCGHAMLADMDQWNRERREAGDAPIEISIGLHYGMVVLGNIGSSRRLEYAVLGDTVNVASRLEELTRALGVRLAMSDALASAVRDDAAADATTLLAGLGDGVPQALRGRDEPISVWTM